MIRSRMDGGVSLIRSRMDVARDRMGNLVNKIQEFVSSFINSFQFQSRSDLSPSTKGLLITISSLIIGTVLAF